jgi:predicted NUDIX family NTP pyrophosphohydrolase
MPDISAGLLMCRRKESLEFFLVHPGGPFYIKKDDGVWTIPKGIVNPGEDLLTAAMREFREETGIQPQGPFRSLGIVKMKSGKVIHAWAFIGDWDAANGIVSNTFSLQWPPRSNTFIEVPEADKASWFGTEEAMRRIHPSQIPFLSRAASTEML